MTPCPTREQFLRYLAEQGSPTEEREIEDHVESCVACKAALNQLTPASVDLGGPQGGAPVHGADPTGGSRAEGADTATGPAPRWTAAGLRYQPVDFHARGGLGEVFRAHDEELNREVALKRIQVRHAGDGESRRRFLREAEITARLEHPGVVPVYGLVHDAAGQPCYAMRFIRGDTLKEAIARFHEADDKPGRDAGERRLALHQLLNRFVAVCNTLAFVHSRGVIHRDLKPSNIMLGKYGETMVVDWGLARSVDRSEADRATGEETLQPSSGGDGDSETLWGHALGTPAYMSPEQAAGRWDEVGTASDIYSLGATLYTLLTGQALLKGLSGKEIQRRVQRGDFVRPRLLKRTIPNALEAICLKAMALEPSDRYATASELAADLEHWLADEPVVAYREPRIQRCVRWARRHKTAVTSGTVALLLTLAAGLGGWFLWQSSEQQAHEYLTKLRSSTEAHEDMALAEVQAGRIPGAERFLQQAIDGLPNEHPVQDLRVRLEERRDRVHRLAAFYRLADEAEGLADETGRHADEAGRAEWEETRHAQVLTASKGALTALGILNQPEWWTHLPDADLKEPQRLQLREAAYRQLLFLAAVTGLQGVKQLGTPEAAPALNASLEMLAQAEGFRPSRTGHVMKQVCLVGLGQGKGLKPLPPGEPTSPTDYFFLGFAHWWIATHAQQHWTYPLVVSSGLTATSGLDFKTPLATAEVYLRSATRFDPQDYWAHFWLAQTIRCVPLRYDEAELCLGTCVALRPKSEYVYVTRSRLIVERIRTRKPTDTTPREVLLDRALADLRLALTLRADSPETYGDLGVCYQLKGDFNQALANFNEAIRLLPTGPYYYLSRGNLNLLHGKLDAAIADLTTATRFDANNPETINLRGVAHFRKGELDLAFNDFSEAIDRLHSKDAVVRGNRGDVYLQRKEFAKAIEDYDKAIAGFDRSTQHELLLSGFHHNRGLAHFQLRHFDLAVANYNDAIRYGAAKFPLHFLSRGNAYNAKGEYALAVADFSEALRLGPPTADAHFGRGFASIRTLDNKQAIDDFTKVLTFIPKHPIALHNRGFAHAQLGQWDRAGDDFASALEIDDKLHRTRTLKAYLLLQAGDRAGLRTACAALLDAFKGTADAETANGVAWASVLTPVPEADRAIVVQLAEKAVSKDPKKSNYQTTLGAAHYRAGRFDRAVEKLEETVKAQAEGGTAADWLFLAMAHQRLDHGDDARKWLTRAVVWIDQAETKPDKPGVTPWFPWDQRLELRTLRAEAEQLVQGSKVDQAK